MAAGSPVGLQQLQRMQGFEWGDSGKGDKHVWIDGGTLYTDALVSSSFSSSTSQFPGPSPWYDVTHPTFGADPTGVADSTTAIQTVINLAIAAGWGNIFIPKGTYKITATLTMHMGRHIRIFSPTLEGNTSSTIFRWDGVASGTMMLMNRCQECAIEGISFVSGSASYGVGIDVDQTTGSGVCTDNHFAWLLFNQPTGSTGMRFANAGTGNVERMNFDHVSFSGPGTYGVQTKHNQTNTFSYYDCSFSYLTYGVSMQGGSAAFYSCNFGNNTGSDTYMAQPGYMVFQQCTAQTSPAFLVSGAGTTGSTVTIIGMNAVPDVVIGTYMHLGYGGSLTMIACDFAAGQDNAAWKIDTSSYGVGQMVAIGCQFPNNSFLAVSAGAMRYTLLNCTYQSSNGNGSSTPLQDVINGTTNNLNGAYKAVIMGGMVGAIGSYSASGLRLTGGGLLVNKLSTPFVPTLTVTGANNGVTYSYYMVSIDVTGKKSLPSPVATTALGPTTLDANNYITIKWSYAAGAQGFDIIRSVGGVAQGSIFLASDAEGSVGLVDNGLTATVYTPLTRSASADSTLQGLSTVAGLAAAITSISTAYAATLDDHTIIVTGTTTVTLPLANAAPGQELEIINNDATLSTTIARAGSNTIEGATTKTLGARYSKVKLRSDGSSVWYIISQQGTVT